MTTAPPSTVEQEGEVFVEVFSSSRCLANGCMNASTNLISFDEIFSQMSGAMSSLDKDKASILTMLETAKANISTFGIALTPCSLPGSKANFSLADDEMELGLGVHGENGIGRTKVS